MAERTPTKIQSFSDWANRPPEVAKSAITEKQRQLWDALNKFVGQEGGWIVSAPGNRQIRIEIPQGSVLPSKLFEFGYSPRHCGTNTRITPTGGTETVTAHSTTGTLVIRQHPGFQNVDVIEITLGG